MTNASKFLIASLVFCAFFGVSAFCFLNFNMGGMHDMAASSASVADHLAMWKSTATALVSGTVLALLAVLSACVLSRDNRRPLVSVIFLHAYSVYREWRAKSFLVFRPLGFALSQGIVNTKRWSTSRALSF